MDGLNTSMCQWSCTALTDVLTSNALRYKAGIQTYVKLQLLYLTEHIKCFARTSQFRTAFLMFGSIQLSSSGNIMSNDNEVP